MKTKVKELECQLEMLATEFFEESGASALNIDIRISRWEITHRVNLEFTDEHANKTCEVPGGCHD